MMTAREVVPLPYQKAEARLARHSSVDRHYGPFEAASSALVEERAVLALLARRFESL